MNTIYTNIKAAPPFSPVIYGKRHTFPNPTALPAVASIIPILLPKPPLVSFVIPYYILYKPQLVEEYYQYTQRTHIFDTKEIDMEELSTQRAPVSELLSYYLVRQIPSNHQTCKESAYRQEHLPRDEVEYVEHCLAKHTQ